MRDTIARLAEEIRKLRPKWSVVVDQVTYSTDRKPRGCRYITHVGKGRKGARIKVYDARGTLLLSHNQAEPYRRTSDVREWMARNGLGQPRE